MRIGLLHPTLWPEVRRGSERLVAELARELAGRGHEPTVITSHPGSTERSFENGVRIVRCRRLPRPPGLRNHEYHLEQVPNVIRQLAGAPLDLVHGFFPSDSWAAVRARRLGGPPVVATLHGIPTREYLVARKGRLAMLTETTRRAAECTVLSEAAAAPFRRYLLRDPRVIGGGVASGAFGRRRRSAAPTLLCPVSLGDPRKRAALLFAAFARLREREPRARLLIAAGADPVMSSALPPLPSGAELVEAAGDELAGLYASAWATVLPSVEEAFGLVLVESLAAGAPVVGARSGAVPEIIDSDAIGRLFEPDNEADLTSAMAGALELAAERATAEACRRRAGAYDWSRVVLDYERLYESVLSRERSARR
jgi:glycosyltransferase involved in cell wall biosynthesis